MKYNDIELPEELKDKDKGRKLLTENDTIILNLDEEYNKIKCQGWICGPRVLSLIPEELKSIWDSEFNWHRRANELFDYVFNSSSGEGHYKYNIIPHDWEHNFAEHYKSQMCVIHRLKQIMGIVMNRPSRSVYHKVITYFNRLNELKEDFE